MKSRFFARVWRLGQLGQLWISESGKINLSVRYRSKTLKLAKGKNAVELATGEELVAVLEKLKAAVLAGELDAQIEAASCALRAGFRK